MQQSNLIYNINDKPPFGKTIVFALQQLLAIIAATITVPIVVGHGMSTTAALFGAGVGTLVYLLFTKFKSPVFLGSSFAFITPMTVAFSSATAGGLLVTELGYLGLIIGAILAGLVYVVIALVIKLAGTAWINKIMPPQVIGPTVALIGLSLAGSAISNLKTGGVLDALGQSVASPYLAILVGLVTLFATIAFSVYGKGMVKMIPFIMAVGVGYVFASILTGIGHLTDTPSMLLVDFAKFKDISWYPDFTFLKAFKGFEHLSWSYIGTIAVAYVPVAFVVFAEHLADHKNLGSIIGNDLTQDPGLHRTLLGDGVGSMAGALFGGCPNTTYGESVGCVALTGNASSITILFTSIIAIVISLIGPFATLLSTLPSCVVGGISIALYGFIASSGIKMIQKVNLEDNRNLYVVAVILITGIGGFSLNIGKVTLTNIACALILGIVTNLICSIKKDKDTTATQTEESDKVKA